MSVHWGGRGAGHVSRWDASVYPLVINFIPAALDARITFTRASTGTFTGSNGLIQTAAIDVARFAYEPVSLDLLGLLIEPQRINVLQYSDQFNNAYWTKTRSSITADSVASPDGSSNADKLVEDTSAGTHWVGRNVAASASTTYTVSIFIKAAERTAGQMQIFGNGGGNTVTFNLTTGTSAATGAYGGWSSASTTITNFGNGWYRITNTATTNVGLTSLDFRLFLENPAGTPSYTGNGTSGFYIWGAQLEVGATASSYMPTVAASFTRNADSASMTIPSNVSKLRYVFDNDAVQDVTVSPGAYTIPTNLNRPIIKAILGLRY